MYVGLCHKNARKLRQKCMAKTNKCLNKEDLFIEHAQIDFMIIMRVYSLFLQVKSSILLLILKTTSI